jgi:hypothetical protein
VLILIIVVCIRSPEFESNSAKNRSRFICNEKLAQENDLENESITKTSELDLYFLFIEYTDFLKFQV